MLIFLAERIFVPLLAAYLITLVVGVALVARHRDPGRANRTPLVGKNAR